MRVSVLIPMTAVWYTVRHVLREVLDRYPVVPRVTVAMISESAQSAWLVAAYTPGWDPFSVGM